LKQEDEITFRRKRQGCEGHSEIGLPGLDVERRAGQRWQKIPAVVYTCDSVMMPATTMSEMEMSISTATMAV